MIVHFADVKHVTGGGVNTVVEFASKQIYAHDAENEPEYKTNQKHIHDGGDCS